MKQPAQGMYTTISIFVQLQVVEIKSFKPHTAVSVVKTERPEASSSSSSSSAMSKQLQQKAALLKLQQQKHNKISWKNTSNPNKLRPNMSEMQRALALNAGLFADPSLKMATSPLLVNLLKQESEAALTEKTNGLDRQTNKIRSNSASCFNGEDRIKSPKFSSSDGRKNKFGSTEDKSVRLKLKLPFDYSHSSDDSSAAGGASSPEANGSAAVSARGGSGGPARKIPKLILSVKDRTIIKKDPRSKASPSNPSEAESPLQSPGSAKTATPSTSSTRSPPNAKRSNPDAAAGASKTRKLESPGKC